MNDFISSLPYELQIIYKKTKSIEISSLCKGVTPILEPYPRLRIGCFVSSYDKTLGGCEIEVLAHETGHLVTTKEPRLGKQDWGLANIEEGQMSTKPQTWGDVKNEINVLTYQKNLQEACGVPFNLKYSAEALVWLDGWKDFLTFYNIPVSSHHRIYIEHETYDLLDRLINDKCNLPEFSYARLIDIAYNKISILEKQIGNVCKV